MPIPSFSIRALRAPWSRRVAALAALPALLVAAPARADDCADDADCGFGFACDTVITSVASTGTGGIGGSVGIGGVGGASSTGGASGKGGAAGTTGVAGAGVGGTFGAAGGAPRPTGGTSSFGGASFGGLPGTGGGGGGLPMGGGFTGGAGGGLSGAGGTAGAPIPPLCGNRFCEFPTESPETCSLDCAYTTVCNPAPCTSDTQCAGGYACFTSGTAGGGGTGNSGFCGDLLCSGIETISTCPFDCDQSLRRCSPGARSCYADADCALGWRCTYVGGGSDEAPATGGNGNGVASPGTCVMGSTGTGGFGGVGGVGGTNSTGATGGTTRGGSDGNGGSDPDAANDEGDVVYTNGGCSLATPSDHSAFAALIVALAALVRFGRRRRANANAR